ncbi:MAG TPA: FRG domain-containing protein [Kineosporiaceae bacterium]|nr:FRG domain-containing protein [Kineosporiaceae bacterium]
MTAIRVISYRDWTEFKRDLFQELFAGAPFRRGEYLFRGSGDADWSLSTTFDRQFAELPLPRRMALWDQLIREWRDGCATAGLPTTVTDDEPRLWALGQHHGLPTRLLDWTTSPYVAAFFAFREHLLARAVGRDHVAVWVLHQNNPVWSGTQGVEIVTASDVDNLRQRNQNGKFTLCRAAVASLEEYVERFARDTALTKCVIPASEARPALADLDAMGINGYDLFPDLSGLATLATMRACLSEDGRPGHRPNT